MCCNHRDVNAGSVYYHSHSGSCPHAQSAPSIAMRWQAPNIPQNLPKCTCNCGCSETNGNSTPPCPSLSGLKRDAFHTVRLQLCPWNPKGRKSSLDLAPEIQLQIQRWLDSQQLHSSWSQLFSSVPHSSLFHYCVFKSTCFISCSPRNLWKRSDHRNAKRKHWIDRMAPDDSKAHSPAHCPNPNIRLCPRPRRPAAHPVP